LPHVKIGRTKQKSHLHFPVERFVLYVFPLKRSSWKFDGSSFLIQPNFSSSQTALTPDPALARLRLHLPAAKIDREN
jgi:hypothetical protein